MYSEAEKNKNIKETPFTQIRKNDLFFIEGQQNGYKALTDVTISKTGAAYELIAETSDGKEGLVQESKNNLAYSKKYFIVIKRED